MVGPKSTLPRDEIHPYIFFIETTLLENWIHLVRYSYYPCLYFLAIAFLL